MKFTAFRALEASEGCRLTAYLDSASVPTIGVGHTGPDVRLGMTITQEQADALLAGDVAWAEDAVRKLVTVPLNQNRFDALVMLVFNIGASAFAKSTLLRRLNGYDYNAAADQFLVWNRAGGKRLQGLADRRERERALFMRPVDATVPQQPPATRPVDATVPQQPPATPEALQTHEYPERPNLLARIFAALSAAFSKRT